MLALGAVATALLAADTAQADYSAKVQADTLTLTGDAASDRLVLQLAPGAPGTLQADVGADGTADFSFDRSTFTAIDVAAGRGDDEVRVGNQLGAFADELVTIDGGSGDDILRGGIGAETLLGGGGNDDVAGGDGDDVARLGGGSDVFTWNPGDDSDTVEGDAGTDRLAFNGSNIGELFDVSSDGDRVRLTRNVASIAMDLDGVEGVDLRALGGADTAVVNDLAGTDLERVDVDLDAVGGDGDSSVDTVIARGTDVADSVEVGASGAVEGLAARTRIVGGDAQDDLVVQALGGADELSGGTGVPGLPTVNLDGGDGADVAAYRGTSDGDLIAIVANGPEVRVDSPGSAPFDVVAEDLVVEALAGPDAVSAVGNLAPLTRLTLDGDGGDDTLLGGNGADRILAGSGDDHVDGQQGQDVALLGGGSDTFQWDPGDGNDTVEGEAGADALRFNGSNIGEILEASANGDRVRFTRNVANIVMDLDGVERMSLRTLGGADTAIVGDVAGTDLEAVDVDLSASSGGGDAAVDTVVARGTDAVDRVEVGESGAVEGLSARTRIVDGGEQQDDLVVQALGGADELRGSVGVPGLPTVNLDGGEGADVATYTGTSEDDQIAVVANGPEVAIDSPASARFDTAAVEDVVLEGLGGGDTMSGVGNLAPLTRLTFDGDAGDDTLLGGNGADLLRGGSGNDHVDGQQGADVAELGGGSDTFQWDPGDGSDTVEGQGGTDEVAFNGSNIGEIFDVSANGDRVRFTRNVASIVMDLDDVERIALRALGGTDVTTVNDLGGTDMEGVDVDLRLTDGTSDPQPDTVVVGGTEKRDLVRLLRSGDQVVAAGLAAQTTVTGSELLSDTLRVQTLGGDDAVTLSPAVEELITPVIDLGADE